ncbi:uncharacterized protein LOC109924975 isoform X2 [Rhincodon typus]|uniref:uncharacterized protein LOC109924975 isoform X2 n=1 Tax=Rhincodon typus TaxID=259920 RepID=UPI00202F5017|nr:uncharacterized protein LOC109924975 isoform X2 [Rhincodon typus]
MQPATERSIPRQEGSKGGSGEQKNVCSLSSNRQLGMSEQAMGDGPVPEPTQTEMDRNGVPYSGSETATKEESPGRGPQMEWSLTPSAEVARNCTININTMPPSLPEKSNTSPRFTVINNYTINITSPVPAGQPEKVPHNYTVNIHSSPRAGLPEKAVNSYTINIGSPTPASLPDRVVNSYTINIGNTTPASLPDRETGHL